MFGKLTRSDFTSWLYSYLRADAPLYLAIVAYTVVGLALLELTDLGHLAIYSTYLAKWVILFAILFPLVALCLHYGLLIHRFDRRRRLAARRIFSDRAAAYFVSGICMVMVLMLFQGTFTSLKNALFDWQDGFPYDRLLADLDAALHFGVDPWRLLHPLGARDWILDIVQWNYGVLWFLICFGVLFYIATSARTAAIRTRYLVSFMLVWIIVGNVFAAAFLSAGPAFYGDVTGDTARFAEQLAFLARDADYDGSAAYYQNYLWMLHQKGVAGFGSGISAFPSVHVALVMLNALFVWERSRKLGLAAFVYVAFVLVSSVYLGWHYAIDGYAAIALTIGIFLLVRKWLPDGAAKQNIAAPRQSAPATAPAALPAE